MELLQLVYFCDAAATQNFSKTAKKYNVPPSNISQSIKRLENELEVALFERTANTVMLSERGKQFYEEIKQSLALINHAVATVKTDTSYSKIRLNIHISRRAVMTAVEKFQRQYPQVDITTQHEPFRNADEFDLIITDQLMEHPSFSKTKIATEKIVLAHSKEFLSEKVPLSAETLSLKPFITMATGNNLHRFTQEICHDLGFVPRIALQSEDPTYVRKCVELGLGAAFVPSYSWRGMLSENVVLRDIGDYTRDIYLYQRVDRYQPKYIDALQQLIVQEFKQ